MARLALSKAQLAREKAALARYRRYLPALDLKRRQLAAERKRTAARIAEIEAAARARMEEIGAEIPMLANEQVDLAGLVAVREVRIGTRNLVGQTLPVVEAMEIDVAPYGRLARPHWVDLAAERLAEVLRLRAEAEVARRALRLLEAALARVTQRVNLFEKVLIPRARADIRRIVIALGDAERAAVVTSKIAKRRRAAA